MLLIYCFFLSLSVLSTSSLERKVLFSRLIDFHGEPLECFCDEGTRCEEGLVAITYTQVQVEMFCLKPGQFEVYEETRLEDIKAAENVRATVQKIEVISSCGMDDYLL